jgi:hypothetical protein
VKSKVKSMLIIFFDIEGIVRKSSLLAWLRTCDRLLFPRLKRLPFWHNIGYWGRMAGGAEYPHRTRLPWCIKNGRGCRNSAYARKVTASRVIAANRPKVSFYQMAVTVPNILENSGMGVGFELLTGFIGHFQILVTFCTTLHSVALSPIHTLWRSLHQASKEGTPFLWVP